MEEKTNKIAESLVAVTHTHTHTHKYFRKKNEINSNKTLNAESKTYNLADNKGITLVALTITIIVLLILASIAIPAGRGTVNSAKFTAFTFELEMMQQEVDKLSEKYRSGEDITQYGKELQGSEEENNAFIGADVADREGYKYFDESTLKSLGLANLSQEFLVNIPKRKVISLSGFNNKGEKVYTISQIPSSKYRVEYEGVDSSSNFDLSIIEKIIYVKNIRYIGNVKKGTIYYGQGNTQETVKWQTAKKDTTDTEAEIEISSEGKWYVKVVDSAGNTSEIKSINAEFSRISIAKNLEDVTATVGEKATFKVELNTTGYGTLEYKWYKTTGNNATGGTEITEATTDTLELDPVTEDMYGTNYYCAITQTNGTYSKTVKTNVAKLNVIINYSVAFNPNSSRLPAGFQEVEYIESTGTQYIDTGVIGKSDIHSKINFTITKTQDQHILSSTNSGNRCCFGVTDQNVYTFGAAGLYQNQGNVDLNKRYNADIIFNKLSILKSNGVQISSLSNNNFNTGIQLYLFARNNSNEKIEKYTFVKLYSCEIYDSLDNYIRNYIPCYSTTTVTNVDGDQCPSGTIGLYDLVEGKFYTNKGTGTFLKGSNVNYYEIDGTMQNQQFIYGTAQNLTTNEYTRTGYTFTGWNTELDGSGATYLDGQEVNNLTKINNETINLYAQWEDVPTINLEETSGTTYVGTPDKTVPIKTKLINSLTVTTADSSIATATVSEVENNQATLAIHPVGAGTTTITVQDSESNASETYTVTVEEINYYAGGVPCATLNEAFTACTTAGTTEILVCKNVTDEDNELVINTHNVDLNLQNYTVTRTNQITINSGRTLNIAGSGTLTSAGSKTIENKGTLSLDQTTTATIANTGNNTTSYPVYNNGGTIVMSNGTIAGVYYGIYMNPTSKGTINMNGGSITTTGETGDRYGIYVEATSNSYAKTITLIGTASVTGGSYGIYENGGNVTVNIGSTSETINKEYPVVTGETYGLYKENNSRWYFYNGIVKGTTAEFNVLPTGQRNGYNILYDEETINEVEYQTAYLTITLKQETVTNNTNGAFLGTGITRNVIESISFEDSLDGFPDVDNNNCWDVSSLANSGEVLLWATDEDENGISDGKYKVVIGQNGGVNANTTSSYLFQYIGNTIDAEIDLEDFNTSCATNMRNMFSGCKKVAELDISKFDLTNVTTSGEYGGLSNMFSGCSSLVNLNLKGINTKNVTYMGKMFNECSSLTELDVSGFDTGKVTAMNRMFYGCSKLTKLDLSVFDTRSVTNMGEMFRDCSSLTELNVSSFNTSNVTSIATMFYGCRSLTKLDVSGFDTRKVTAMNNMFDGCKSLTELDVGSFNTSNVTGMAYMFRSCSSITVLDISNFDLTNVTTVGEYGGLSNMFNGCSSLANLNVSGINTENVTYMRSMFSGCSSLTELDVSGFETGKVTSMNNMFYGCRSLTKLDLSVFDTSSVTNMTSMFSGCNSLTELDVSGFDTSNVTSMPAMFNGCGSLTELDVSGFDTSNVTNMYAMFNGCSSLTELDISGFDTSNVTNMYEMFKDCTATTIYIGNLWDISKVTNSGRMFYRCSKLVGGAGTTIAGNPIDATYAKIDGGQDNPGYFTAAPLWLRHTEGEIEVNGEANIQIIGGNLGTLSATSSDENIATESIEGTTLVVTGLSTGTATITVTEDNLGQTATYEVTVVPSNS